MLGQQRNNLEVVKFVDNGLAAKSMALLEDWLAGSEHLTTLIFENQMAGSEGAMHFAHIVASCPLLTTIKYAQAHAGCDGACAILEAIVDNTGLNLVTLDNNGTKLLSEDEDDGVILLGGAILQNTTLTHLDIGDCELTNIGRNQLLPFLLQADLSLEFFNVCDNELSFVCCNGLANLLCQQQPTLCTLHASLNQFTDQGVQILMSAYSDTDDNNPACLESIDYSTNELGHGTMLALVDAHLPNLQTITLSSNCFRPDDVRKLQDRFGTALQELEENDEDSMSYDKVGDK
jgi:Ran GTPase-activating protein (RanGAP) involved in mRNA processing and transport